MKKIIISRKLLSLALVLIMIASFPFFTGFVLTAKASSSFGLPLLQGNIITFGFGAYSSSQGKYHLGIDYGNSGNAATDVLAIADGEVYSTFKTANSGGWGNLVIIKHKTVDGKYYYSGYGHMVENSVCVSVGDKVSCGTKLGIMGSTGNSTGPHVHLFVCTGISLTSTIPSGYTTSSFSGTATKNGITYYNPSTVISTNGTCIYGTETENSTQPTTAPSAPEVSVNKAIASVGESITVTWNDCQYATYYWVTIWSKSLGEQVVSESANGTSYTFTPSFADNFTIIVQAYNDVGSAGGNRCYVQAIYPPVDVGDDFFAKIVNVGSGTSIGNYDGDVLLSDGGIHDPRQFWHFYRLGDLSYVVYNAYDGSLLTAEKSGNSNETNVICDSQTWQDGQHWYIRQIDGVTSIAPVYSDRVLNLSNGNTEPGTNVQLYDYNGTNAQNYTLYIFDEHNVAYAKPAAPDAPVLSIKQEGSENEETVFEWTASPLKSDYYDNRTYNFRIWQGKKVGENTEVYVLVSNLPDTSYRVSLPAGVYTATVTAVNTKYHWYGTASEPFTFMIAAKVNCDKHTWNTGVITSSATCTANGVMTYTCTICGATKTEPIEKNAHTPVVIDGLAASCTESGYTASDVCEKCGTVLTVSQIIPATGHVDNDKDGYCDNCSKDISMLPKSEMQCVCGQYHTGTLAPMIRFFHRIIYFFRNLLIGG